MKRHIIETILQEILLIHELHGEVKDKPLFDEVLDRLTARHEIDELTLAELEALQFLQLIDDRRPDYKWDKDKPITKAEHCEYCDGTGTYEGGKFIETTCEHCGGTGFKPTEKGAGDDYPVMNLKNAPPGSDIFIDGGFDPDSYEARIQRSKGKKP